MIEINFVKKKKINIAPYILVTIVLFSLSIIYFSLYLYRSNVDETYTELQQEILQKTEIIAEISNINELEKQNQTLSAQVDQLEATVYPSLYLLDEVNANLPSESKIENYTFSIIDGITVGIHITDLKQAADFSQKMNKETYIVNLNLISLEKQNDYTLAIFNFEVNKDYILEEADRNEN